MDLNKVMLIGRLTKQPELRSTTTGQSVASFSLATNRVYTDSSNQKQEKAEFHNIVAWGKLADICNQYLSKGRRAYIEGRMQTRDWVAQDGTRRFTTEVVADNMIILDPPTGGSGAPSSRPEASVPSVPEPEQEQTIETIPF